MRILVTGGAGFIGSHLCEMLCKNHEVVCMDSLITGSKDNVEGMPLEFVKHDIRQPFDVKCDAIFNMASPASPIDYQNYYMETLEANSFGVKNVLENARKHGARVVHASTSEIYGDPLEHPQKETYWGNVNTLGPRSCYDESKRFAETLCYNHNQKYGTEIVLVRIFNTYGERMRMDDGRVVPNFITQALAGKDITIYGDGKQTRSFCYVSDLCDALSGLASAKMAFDVFNAGNPDELTMNDVAKTVIELTGSRSKLVHMALPKDDPKKRKPDITKIRSTIGWSPKVKFRDGMKRTIEWFKTQEIR